ncbi:30S ribosomal protein S20 [Candidatus Uhrbacteria bacterium CG_4_10_14_0_2_um_filter_41_7]|uniref:Small ribosomal subunit protein bS20 n=1 Tax=Candidatus Uhrbacteria bacterium CG_4_9_14_3_um_filter_41_35 TaxID=1975034 RepID=A0A2M7XGL3_9BACT|nr:MAG: 30S ribosomal protein S20 [Candidatus Uhrbacteria bacterium CG11_big_fil_rev_8_21_14_0_20_41_9]PIZ55504.1 MAG: 30S ribosomal protein S20 [Candidatus Uhrbacteria bacterium CG_4_10_14_0_2_um_filter_41_7]PJA47018.1 MAG: 30S ribosomal protein S20 [Candidatus Uhrbacteria bacterium CG_4_9_14_3_um_filter_41_35]
MPNLENAKKALRQADKRAARNQIVKDEIHSLRRAFRKLVDGGKLEDAKQMLPLLDKKLDKAVTKNIFKKNKIARVKSRLALKLGKANAK